MKEPAKKERKSRGAVLEKAPTGIHGLDQITGGGFPARRATLVCGAAGCGKTLLGMEFLLRGAQEHGEPGVFVAFEESSEELATNVASLGFDLAAMVERKQIFIDQIIVEPNEIAEAGAFDLEALFIRLAWAIDAIGAKRVVLDTIETLLVALPNPGTVRAELRRLFRWLKDRGVTTVITGERGEQTLTRFGIEEYVSDCVVVLDHRVVDQTSTRRLRIMKYRGSTHGTNEYPFLIDSGGFSLLPVTSLGLDHEVSNERISTGVPQLNDMLGGAGYYRGSSILLSGSAGSGKTTLAAHFAAATSRRGERCLYFLFEESPHQLMRNMRAVGLDLEPLVKKDLLRFRSARPSLYGLEMHLSILMREVDRYEPEVVILDPMSSFSSGGNGIDVKSMLIRLADTLKERGITLLMVNLTQGGSALEHTDVEISSVIDTWLLLRDVEFNGERNRVIYVLKSRGMAHSNQIREMVLSSEGVQLKEVYVGPGGVLTGSSRVAQEARDRSEQLLFAQEVERQKLAVERKRAAIRRQIAELEADLESEEAQLTLLLTQAGAQSAGLDAARLAIARTRGAEMTAASGVTTKQTRKGARA